MRPSRISFLTAPRTGVRVSVVGYHEIENTKIAERPEALEVKRGLVASAEFSMRKR